MLRTRSLIVDEDISYRSSDMKDISKGNRMIPRGDDCLLERSISSLLVPLVYIVCI